MAEKRQGLGSKLRSAIFETTESEPTRPATPVFSMAPPTAVPLYTTPGASSSVDPGMLAEVESHLAASTPEAYRKFTALLDSMVAIPDERMRLTTALNVAQTTLGLSAEQVRAAYEARLAALDKIEVAFNTQSEEQLKKATTDAQTDLTRIQTDTERHAAQIQQLQREAAELQQQLSTKQSELVHAQTDINELRARMTAAIRQVREKAASERDTVSRNIPAGGR